MQFQYHTKELKQLLLDFQSITGISVGITNESFEMLIHPDPPNPFCKLIQSSEKGRIRCQESDRKLLEECRTQKAPCSHLCHAGLTDTAVPIVKNGSILGYILFGQVCQSNKDPLPFCKLLPMLTDLAIPTENLEAAYRSLCFLEQRQIESAAAIIDKLTKYIWLEHLIDLRENDPFESLIDYLNTHISQTYTVASLCRRFNIPKNTLYSEFHTRYQCTFNEYLTSIRIKEAERQLLSTTLPVYQICENVGIGNYQYFCRRFKELKGDTPLRYRKRYTAEKNGKEA